MRFAGESACATTGKRFACKGGAGAFACQFRFREYSQLPDGGGSDVRDVNPGRHRGTPWVRSDFLLCCSTKESL